jgi:hypothetical protein
VACQRKPFCYKGGVRLGPKHLALAGVLATLGAGIIFGAEPPAAPPRFTLRSEKYWQLNLPNGERFDASGLVLMPDGELLTVSDRGAGLYRICFLSGTNAADLSRIPDCFTPEQLAPFAAEKVDRWDCEGVTRDEHGRLYICEEANRWIMRWDPKTKRVERLDIDWSPVRKYFHPTDRNASFEGIAVGGGKLYVANERQRGRIIVVDLGTLKVEREFQVSLSTSQARDTHYSDLCWFEGELWVLLRESSAVLKVDPVKETVLAEFSFGEMERQREVVYNSRVPTSTMEGLAVDAEFIWLCTDNNGEGRWSAPQDKRPTLFKCKRPDVKRKE